MRPFVIIGLTVVILLACVPTEPCACPPALGIGTVYGTVTDATGRAVTAVPIRLRVARTDCADPENILVDDPTTVTDGAGKYRYALRTITPVDEGCVEVGALSPSGDGLASATARLRLVSSNGDRHRDSVRVDLRLP